MRHYIFDLRLLSFDPWSLFAILKKNLLYFFLFVQYIFTRLFKYLFHAYYFFIHNCNTFDRKIIP